jgi:hypothetical protein
MYTCEGKPKDKGINNKIYKNLSERDSQLRELYRQNRMHERRILRAAMSKKQKPKQSAAAQ